MRCAGNNWGRDENGTSCLGCGAQEEFYGCADVAIDNTTSRQRAPAGALNEVRASRPQNATASLTQTTAVVMALRYQVPVIHS